MKNFIKLLFISLLLVACGAQDGDGQGTTDGVTDSEHRVFVSSASYQGNMGGLTQADANCKSLAQAAGLSRNYKAILSDSSNNAKDRLDIVGAIYVFSTSGFKTLVAASSTDFWAADTKDLLSTISVDEKLASASGLTVWTGSGVEGAVNTEHCTGWSTTSGSGFYGLTNRVDEQWIESNTTSCNNSYRIYCISQ